MPGCRRTGRRFRQDLLSGVMFIKLSQCPMRSGRDSERRSSDDDTDTTWCERKRFTDGRRYCCNHSVAEAPIVLLRSADNIILTAAWHHCNGMARILTNYHLQSLCPCFWSSIVDAMIVNTKITQHMHVGNIIARRYRTKLYFDTVMCSLSE